MADNTVCTCKGAPPITTRDGTVCMVCGRRRVCQCPTPDPDPESDQLVAPWCRGCYRPLDRWN